MDAGHAVHRLDDDPATCGDWLRRAEPLPRTLRPHLPAEYEGYLRTMFAEGAAMAVLHHSGAPRALAVYRMQHTTFHGLRFYLDDLVTDAAARGQGLGGALLDWCIRTAREAGCDTFALDSGVQRAAAHRFYFRHGLTIGSFGFNLGLD